MSKRNNVYKKIIIGIAVAVIVLVGGVFVYLSQNKPSDKKAAEHTGSHKESSNQTDNSQPMGEHSENDGHANHEPVKAVEDLTAQAEVQMDIKDFAYTKSNIRIKKGTKVTWTNRDDIQHNVMLEHEGANQAHDPPTKEELDPNEFAGPLLAKGESYSFTFNQATENAYHCSPHPYMKGRIEVVE